MFINNNKQPHNCVRPSYLGYLIFALQKLANQLKLLDPPPLSQAFKIRTDIQISQYFIVKFQLYSAKNTVQIPSHIRRIEAQQTIHF